MKVITETKRPWTIKWSVGLLSFVFITGFIEEVSKHNVNLALHTIQITLISVMLLAIWRGYVWGRNILFLYTLLIFPVLVILLGLTIMEPFTLNFTQFFQILFISAMVLLFMKPSNEWFAMMRGESILEETQSLYWYFQLAISTFFIGVGVLAAYINGKLELLVLMRDVIHSLINQNERFTMIVAIDAFGFLIGAIAVVLPFGVLLGYWKHHYRHQLIRLIIYGVTLSTLIFASGKTIFDFSMYFVSKFIVIVFITFVSLMLGTKIREYRERGNTWQVNM